MMTSDSISVECKVIDAALDQVLVGRAASSKEQFSQQALSQQALSHLHECSRCRALYDWFLQEPGVFEPSANVYTKVQAELKRSLRPVSPQAGPGALAARFLLVFLLFAGPIIGMMGAAGWRRMTAIQLMGMAVILTCGAGLLCLSLAWQMTPGSLQSVPPRVAMMSLAAGFFIGAAILFPWQAPVEFIARGWICLRAGLALAVPAALLFWLLVRRGWTLGVGTLGATLGAIAGLTSVFILQFHCNRQDAGHLLTWHGAVLILSIGLGLAAAKGLDWLASRRA